MDDAPDVEQPAAARAARPYPEACSGAGAATGETAQE